MNVLLSIKPKYVYSIIDGNKKYEFRKQIFSRKMAVNLVFIYASSPIKKVVGFFTIEKIIESSPEKLWCQLSQSSGMSEKDFFDYFTGKEIGYAIKIKNFHPFNKQIDPHEVIKNFRPPQSYCYIENMDAFKPFME